MLVIFTKRRTRAVSSLYLSPSNGTQVTSAQPAAAAAGPWHWFHICLIYQMMEQLGHCGHWPLSAFCPDDLKPGFPRHSHRGRGPVGRQRWPPNQPIKWCHKPTVLSSTAWWPTLNKTSPAAPRFLCILVAEDLLSFVLASRGKCHNLVHQTSETGYPRLNHRPLYLVRMVRKWSSL